MKNYNYTCKHGTVWQQYDVRRPPRGRGRLAVCCFKDEEIDFELVVVVEMFPSNEERIIWLHNSRKNNHWTWVFSEQIATTSFASAGNCELLKRNPWRRSCAHIQTHTHTHFVAKWLRVLKLASYMGLLQKRRILWLLFVSYIFLLACLKQLI